MRAGFPPTFLGSLANVKVETRLVVKVAIGVCVKVSKNVVLFLDYRLRLNRESLMQENSISN